MIHPRTLGTMLALGALTALPGCSYFAGAHQDGGAAPSAQYTAPASHRPAQYGEQSNGGGAVSNVKQPISTAMVRQVQEQLKREGLYRGHVDGLWGPKSQRAAALFQRRHDMKPTGKIDLAMLRAMNLGESNAQYGESGPAPSGGMGPNGHMSGQPYDQANVNRNMAQPDGTGAHNGTMNATGNGMQPGAGPNYSTGNQNPSGSANASNAQFHNDNAGTPNTSMTTGATGDANPATTGDTTAPHH